MRLTTTFYDMHLPLWVVCPYSVCQAESRQPSVEEESWGGSQAQAQAHT